MVGAGHRPAGRYDHGDLPPSMRRVCRETLLSTDPQLAPIRSYERLVADPRSCEGRSERPGGQPSLVSALRAAACAPAVSMPTGSAPNLPPVRASKMTVTRTLR